MKKFIISIIFLFISCADYFGKPIPIGDEFEDLWHKIEFNELVNHIEPSKINNNEFFIVGTNSIYLLDDSIKMVLSFSLAHELTTLSPSFSNPERLLIGTDNGYIFYCSRDGVLFTIELPSFGYIKFISFSPFDTSTIFIANYNLLLKSSLQGNTFDTLFHSSAEIVKFLVQQSGAMHLATDNVLYRSTNQGLQWDTLYISPEGLINDFAVDEGKRLYLSVGNRILISQNGVNWVELYNDQYGNFSIVGIVDGLILARPYGNGVDAYKLKSDGKIYDISMGIINNFSRPADLPVLIAVNNNRYLISFRAAGEYESALLHFFDTILPP